MPCTSPGGCKRLAMTAPSMKRARRTAAQSSTASAGPKRRTTIVSLTTLSSWSQTRMITPCWSTKGSTAGCDGASSGSSSSRASTRSSTSRSASSSTRCPDAFTNSAASSEKAAPDFDVTRTVRRPKCALAPNSWAAVDSRHLAQASRSGCCSSWGKTTAPSALAAWSSGSSPSATACNTSVATNLFLETPRMKTFTSCEASSSSSSRNWSWPP
mmetsp:Transcript_34601/g.98461  ORF Transcript_34601/g.98461 Transcript_34601/m.98461 type:complete len:214 (+) Transcript_34601:395-1036(+)